MIDEGTTWEIVRRRLNPNTAVCPKCDTLEMIERVTTSRKFLVQRRESDGWVRTDAEAFERVVILECGHSKGLVGV